MALQSRGKFLYEKIFRLGSLWIPLLDEDFGKQYDSVSFLEIFLDEERVLMLFGE